jgi:hypothetical protein
MSEPDLSRRRGCGCLGCLPQLLGLAAILALVYLAIPAIIAPWIYNVGGHTRLLPVWEGVGTLHAPSRGGDYPIYVSFSPNYGGTKSTLQVTSADGYGAICTPAGQTFRLHIKAYAQGIVRNMNGHSFQLILENRPLTWSVTSPNYADWKPRLELNGRWVGDTLAMTDGGSLSGAFLPDGTLNPHPAGLDQAGATNLPITIVEGPRSAFDAACKARGR